jgi:hypothetical protein
MIAAVPIKLQRGQALTLRYNPAANNQVQDGERIDENDLVQYARNSLDELPKPRACSLGSIRLW